MKSTTCTGSNNQYLEEYHNEAAARIGSEIIKQQYGHDLVPYLCRKCQYWHLQPVTTTRLCMFCTDSALFQKDIYATRQDAEAKAKYLEKEKRIKLYPYKCPYSNGWHLSHLDAGKKKR